MRDALKSYLALAGGVTEVTRQRAVEAAKALVASGEAAAGQVTTLAEDLLTQTRQNREAVAALVGFEVDRALGRVGLASADEVTALTERVRALEGRLAQQVSGAGASAGKTGPAAMEGGGSTAGGSAGSAASSGKGAAPAKKPAEGKAGPAKAAAAKTPAKAAAPATKTPATKTPAKKAPAAKGGT